MAVPGGGHVVVRPVAAGDVDGLTALYGGLSDEDRYRRFFSYYFPPGEFFERMVTVAERGGFGVVALDGPDVVGEANYELLANGNGELGMAVAEHSRGWLGPFLLDTLIEAAAARGVPNIEAAVLVTNARMLAVLRSRGYATLPSDDWVSLRLVVGTRGRTPAWPARRGGTAEPPRVVVECPGGRWRAEQAAGAAGLDLITCSGPRGPRPRCPALAGRACPLAAGADAIVIANAPDAEPWRSLAAAHAQLHPGIPVCVEPRGGPPLPVEEVDRSARRDR